MWGFAKMAYVPGELVLQNVLDYLTKSLDGFLSIHLSEILWALASMQQHPGKHVLQTAMARISSDVDHFYPMDIAKLMWAYVVFNEHPGHQTLSLVTKSILADPLRWRGQEPGILLLWGFANFGFFPGLEILDFLKDGVDPSSCLDSFGLDWVVRLLYSFSKFYYHPGDRFLEQLSLSLTQSTCQPKCDMVEIMLWAYATFSFHPGQKLLVKCAQHAEEDIGTFTPLQLANLLWAYELFDLCERDVWCMLVNQIHLYPPHTIPPQALLRLYQVSCHPPLEQLMSTVWQCGSPIGNPTHKILKKSHWLLACVVWCLHSPSFKPPVLFGYQCTCTD